MAAGDVAMVLDILESVGIAVGVDGGWGVDALAHRQTRQHDDLDLVVSVADGELVVRSLEGLRFNLGEDERPTRFVLRDHDHHRIDRHTVSFDEAGDGYQILQDGWRYRYGRARLSGHGRIGDRDVRCLTAEAQIECHQGYEPDDDDRHDMRLLAEHFGLALPPYRPSDTDR